MVAHSVLKKESEFSQISRTPGVKNPLHLPEILEKQQKQEEAFQRL